MEGGVRSRPMELTEERIREIVREEIEAYRDEWRKAHTFDKFIDHLEKDRPDLLGMGPKS